MKQTIDVSPHAAYTKLCIKTGRKKVLNVCVGGSSMESTSVSLCYKNVKCSCTS